MVLRMVSRNGGISHLSLLSEEQAMNPFLRQGRPDLRKNGKVLTFKALALPMVGLRARNLDLPTKGRAARKLALALFFGRASDIPCPQRTSFNSLSPLINK